LQIKSIGASIAATVLAILLFVAAYFFMAAYSRYATAERQLGQAARQVRLLEQHRREQARKRRILERVRRFIDKARATGAQRERWDYYSVNIDEPVSFREAQKILGQTVNTGSYYFRPVALHMKKEVQSGTESTGVKKDSLSADSKESKQADIFLSLKGEFVIRRK